MMNRFIKQTALPFIAVVSLVGFLFGCGVTVSQNLLNDGNLLIAGLQAVSSVMTIAGAPAKDTDLVNVAVAALQAAELGLSAGVQTPATFAKLAQDEMAVLAPSILADLHANATITDGVTLAEKLIPVIVADTGVMPVAAAQGPAVDPRGALADWIKMVGR